MKKSDYKNATLEHLIQEFIDILTKQEKAAAEDNIRLYNKYYVQIVDIREELKSRLGDERRSLVPLLQHNGYAVRYFAAVATLTIAPQQAVQTLEILAYSLQYPYAYKATGTLNSLRSGSFVPS